MRGRRCFKMNSRDNLIGEHQNRCDRLWARAEQLQKLNNRRGWLFKRRPSDREIQLELIRIHEECISIMRDYRRKAGFHDHN